MPTTPADEPTTAVFGDETGELPPVPEELVFTTRAKERPKTGGEPLRFEVDGETCTAYLPAEDSFALLAAAAARSMPTAERIATVMRFLDVALDEASAVRLRDRLEDPDDDFDLSDLFDIMVALIKQWVRDQPSSARQRGARRRR